MFLENSTFKTFNAQNTKTRCKTIAGFYRIKNIDLSMLASVFNLPLKQLEIRELAITRERDKLIADYQSFEKIINLSNLNKYAMLN